MNLFCLALLVLLGGSLVSLLLFKNRLVSVVGTGTTALGALLALWVAIPVLLTGMPQAYLKPWQVPGGAFALLLDPLAAFFVVPVALLSLFCAVYAGPYMGHGKPGGTCPMLGGHWFLFNLMVLAMLLVVTAANVVLFLVGWELMTIASFFLVAWDHHQVVVRKAAWLYLLAAHCGMVMLLALFLLAGTYSGGFNFSDFGRLTALEPLPATVLFLLALFGFGVKAGLFPVHIWLPDAHPVAPSHVSALMSGVLIKTGIYGILRVLSWLPAAPVWWGWLVCLLGAAGALYGIAMATQQRDIKRCLAYSTVENVGIIFLALGFSLALKAQGHDLIALFAGAGALLHLWNHALFKGVMFLGAGAVMHATGTRDMNQMGGLLRRMPIAGVLWIGGSLAIAALPPLNGLVSEWLIYFSLLGAGTLHSGLEALAPLLLFGALGVVGALAIVTFTRLIGICLLGQPRDPRSTDAHEAAPLMLMPMGVLLGGCLVIGLYPQGALALLAYPLAQVTGLAVSHQPEILVAPLGPWALLLLVMLVLLAAVLTWLRCSRPLVRGYTWGCGFRFPSPRMAYTAESYSEMTFRYLLPQALRPQVSGGKVRRLFPAPAQLDQQSTDPLLMRVFQPLFAYIALRCQHLRWLQQGCLQVYLCYIFIASMILMAWSFWAGGHG